MTSHPIAKPRPAARRRPPRQARHKRLWGLLLVTPWLLGLLLFKLVPILASLSFSLTDFFLLTPNEVDFVWFDNYLNVLRDDKTWAALLGTLQLAAWILPLQTGASMLLATLLSSKRLWLKDTLRVLFFLPSIIPSAAATFMWQGFIRPGSGWLYTLILGPLGLGDLIRISSRSPTSGLIVLASLWTIGPGMLIILGAMQGVESEIYEAAAMDGAGWLRRFFSMTLPMVSPAVFFSLVLNLTAVFGGAILLDRGRSFNSNLSSYDNLVYYVLFRTFRLGEASSLAWLFFVLVMILVVILFWSARYWVYYPDRENGS
ncbi:MAG: sugar ABC transporter permease [Anaerolineales bacterium]|nr:sugar ABC transporter permease [Anaerolineales bacterium]